MTRRIFVQRLFTRFMASLGEQLLSSLILLFYFLILLTPSASRAESSQWQEIDQGLSFSEFDVKDAPDEGFKITVVRVDPAQYAFRLLSAKEVGSERLTVKEWCRKYGLTAAVNAGMYQADGLTSVGYMKNFSHLNNSYVGKENTFLVFNPAEASLPAVQIIDRQCQGFNVLKSNYQTMIQSIRMISCEGKNVWNNETGKWSTVAVAQDEDGDILFIFSQSPQSVHDLAQVLLTLPLSIKTAMYLEGGPQASLYLATDRLKIEKYGSLETGFEGSSPFQLAWPIPNVIGIERKK